MHETPDSEMRRTQHATRRLVCARVRVSERARACVWALLRWSSASWLPIIVLTTVLQLPLVSSLPVLPKGTSSCLSRLQHPIEERDGATVFSGHENKHKRIKNENTLAQHNAHTGLYTHDVWSL